TEHASLHAAASLVAPTVLYLLNHTQTAAIHTLSLHDALPISGDGEFCVALRCALLRGELARCYAGNGIVRDSVPAAELAETESRSEEHTSELQSRGHLVCRRLLEKKGHTGN